MAVPSEVTPLMSPAGRPSMFGPGPLPRNLRRSVTPADGMAPMPSGSNSGSHAALARYVSKDKLSLQGETWRHYWYTTLRPHSHRTRSVVFRYVIVFLVVMNVVDFILASDKQLQADYRKYFDMMEAVSSITFLVEYTLRVWTMPERERYRTMTEDPWVVRRSWMWSWESLIDLIALMPWFLEGLAVNICRISGKGCDVELPNLAPLRVVRLFRLLRAAPVMEAFDTFARVIFYNSEILLVALILCCVLLLVMATILFYLAPPGKTEDDFSSILATMYLSVMMLTGQGQPEGKLPWYTKLIVVVTAVFAVAQFAIPASMLTWGFEAEAERRMRKQFRRKQKKLDKLKSGVSNPDLSSSSSDGEAAWEDYERQIVDASESGSSDVASDVDLEQKAAKASSEETAVAAPQVLMNIAQQLESLNGEMKRLREKNEALESENKLLKCEDRDVKGV